MKVGGRDSQLPEDYSPENGPLGTFFARDSKAGIKRRCPLSLYDFQVKKQLLQDEWAAPTFC